MPAQTGEWESDRMANPAADASAGARPMTAEERKIIVASSVGTIFEWYDF